MIKMYKKWLTEITTEAKIEMNAAKKLDREFNKNFGCPDDQIIYAMYETKAAYYTYKHCLDVLQLSAF